VTASERIDKFEARVMAGSHCTKIYSSSFSQQVALENRAKIVLKTGYARLNLTG